MVEEKIIRVGSGEGRTEYEIRYELEKDWEDRFVEVKIRYYPTIYGNYVETIISVYPWKHGGICVDVGRIRQSWHGTGADDILTACYDVEAEEIPILEDPSMVEKIETEKDVYELLRWIYDDLLTPAEIFKENVLYEED
jgi:hypothetical protein